MEIKTSPYTYKCIGVKGLQATYSIFEGDMEYSEVTTYPDVVEALIRNMNVSYNRGVAMALKNTNELLKKELNV